MIYAFEEIKEKAPSKLSSIFVYFEKFYIGKKCRFKNSDVRKVPSYPIKMWNVHNRVLNGDPRTNNSIEFWHKQFAVVLFYYLTN